jgi:hypothetical protein
VIGAGASTLFWTDRWMQGKSIAELAPELTAAVPRRFLKQQTVQEALNSGNWASDVRNDLSDRGFLQLICIWISVQEFQLAPGVADQHIWTPSPSGSFSKSAYDCFFLGAVTFEPADRIWRTWAPPKCKFFLWLAALNRCWTADRLAAPGEVPLV